MKEDTALSNLYFMYLSGSNQYRRFATQHLINRSYVDYCGDGRSPRANKLATRYSVEKQYGKKADFYREVSPPDSLSSFTTGTPVGDSENPDGTKDNSALPDGDSARNIGRPSPDSPNLKYRNLDKSEANGRTPANKLDLGYVHDSGSGSARVIPYDSGFENNSSPLRNASTKVKPMFLGSESGAMAYDFYFMRVEKDYYYHYTYRDRAEEIIEDGHLRPNFYNDQPGAKGAYAISGSYGQEVTSLQVSGSRKEHMDKIVALKFKTRTEPKYGYPEEVIWDKPVKLIRPEIVGVSKAVSDLNRNEDLGENFKVFYDFKKAVEIKKEYGESSSRVASRFRMRRGSLTNLSQQIKQEYGVELSLLDNGEIIELIKIVIPKDQRGLGLGSKIMGEITAWADQKGKIISLTPSKDFGGSSVSRLVRFYSQFGFKKNKGRNKDFRTRDTMLRYPSEAQGGKVAGLIKPPKRLINDINDFVCHTFITNILYGEDEFREGYTEEELQYFRDNNSFTSKEIKEAQYSGLVLKEIDFPLSSYGLDDTRYKNLKVSVKWADPKGSASAHFHPVTGELSFFWIGQISSNSHGAKHFCNFLKSMVIHEATHAMQYVKHEGGGLPARKKKLPFNVYEYSKSSNYLNNVRYLKNKYGERYGEVFHTLTGVEFYPVLLQQVLSFRFHFQEQNKSHTNSDIRRYLSDSDFFFFLKEEMPKMYLKAVGIFIDEVNKTKEEGLSYKKASRPIRVASLIKKSSF